MQHVSIQITRACSLSFLPLLPDTYSSFFFNDTATTEIYTLSLHDALPISPPTTVAIRIRAGPPRTIRASTFPSSPSLPRSEEHTSELQSHLNLVCRLLLEKKKSILLPTMITSLALPSTFSNTAPKAHTWWI